MNDAVREAHAHAAQAKSRNFQVAISKFALLHCFSFRTRFSHPEIRIKRHGSGSPILPIYCLFLSLVKESLAHSEPRGYSRQQSKEAMKVKNINKSATPSLDRAREFADGAGS